MERWSDGFKPQCSNTPSLQYSNLVSQKFTSKVLTIGATELVLKSPSVPLFQRGNFLRRNLTPLWKRGEGEIFGGSEVELFSELLDQDTRECL
jgi:hypothetical protein